MVGGATLVCIVSLLGTVAHWLAAEEIARSPYVVLQDPIAFL